MSRRPLATCALLLALATAAPAQTEYEAVRDGAMLRLGQQLQAGELDAARRDLGDYLDRFPGDALMQYNQACLVALTGDADGALARLRTAVEAGYRDLERPRQDPDLISLVDDPRLEALLTEAREDLVADMLAAEVYLEAGAWSEPWPLVPDPLGPGDEAAAGQVRVRHDAAGLAVEVTPPPAGADEAIVCVALPRSLEEHETRRWFEFRATLDGPGPVPRIARHGRLDPALAAGDLTRAGEVWTLRLPWSSLHPYRPPVELLLGLDVILRRDRGTVPADRWALVRDPHAASPLTPWRRFAPLVLDPGPEPERLVAGRLDTYLVVGDSLSVELGIQGLPGGEVRVSQTVDDRSDTTFAAVLDPELAYLTLLYRLPAEPATGWFELGAVIDAGPHDDLVWHDRGFRLHPDWFVVQNKRLAALPEAERPIVQYHLVRTLRGQQGFQPHDDPSDLAAAAQQAGELLDRAEEQGSVLPPGGGLLDGAFPLGDDALQACRLVLPDEARRRGGALVVVVTASRELSAATAAQLAARRADDDPRTYLVMPVRMLPGRADLATASIRGAALWGLALTSAGSLRLVGTTGVQQYVLEASGRIDTSPVASLLLNAELAGPPPAHVTMSGPVASNPASWSAAILAWD